MAEMALVLPFLATFVLGVIDAGRIWQLKNRMTNAAREGVTVAQYQPGEVNSGCATSVKDAVDAEDDGANVTRNVTVTLIHGSTRTTYTSGCVENIGVAGDTVEVTVTSPVVAFSPGLAAVAGSTINVSGYAHAAVIR